MTFCKKGATQSSATSDCKLGRFGLNYKRIDTEIFMPLPSRKETAKLIAMQQRKVITLDQIKSDLESMILSRNLEAPFEVRKERNYLFVLCPLPNKHNFLVREERKRKTFIVNVIHDFPPGTEKTIQTSQSLTTRGQIRVRFDAYLNTIQHFIQNHL